MIAILVCVVAAAILLAALRIVVSLFGRAATARFDKIVGTIALLYVKAVVLIVAAGILWVVCLGLTAKA